MATTTAQLKTADPGQAPEKQKKSKKKLILILLVVLLLGGGGGAAYFLLMGGSGTKKVVKPVPGAVNALSSITVNLADGHYLKVGIALQLTNKVKNSPDGSKALDLTITEFSNRSVAELSSNTAREAAKADLVKKLETAYDGEVMGIYFTEFVMQ